MKVLKRLKIDNAKGITLVEVVVSAGVLALIISGLLISYLRCLELVEISRAFGLATRAASSVMENVKATPFDNIAATFDGASFMIDGLTGRSTVSVEGAGTDILTIAVASCWQRKNGRVTGEDTNLDGILQVSEDEDHDGVMDSSVRLVSRIFKR